jgi:hypothetical protein
MVRLPTPVWPAVWVCMVHWPDEFLIAVPVVVLVWPLAAVVVVVNEQGGLAQDVAVWALAGPAAARPASRRQEKRSIVGDLRG